MTNIVSKAGKSVKQASAMKCRHASEATNPKAGITSKMKSGAKEGSKAVKQRKKNAYIYKYIYTYACIFKKKKLVWVKIVWRKTSCHC